MQEPVTTRPNKNTKFNQNYLTLHIPQVLLSLVFKTFTFLRVGPTKMYMHCPFLPQKQTTRPTLSSLFHCNCTRRLVC